MVNYGVICAMRSKANSVEEVLMWTSDAVHCVGKSTSSVPKEEEEKSLLRQTCTGLLK